MDMSMIQPYLEMAKHGAMPFMAGVVLTHPLLCANLLFKAWMAFPLTRAYTLAHPDQVIAFVEAFKTELEKCIQKAVAAEAPSDQAKP